MVSELGALAFDAVIDKAYQWLCKRRRHYPANADVWSLRRQWPIEKPAIQATLRAGRYRFAPLQRLHRKDSDEIDLWSAREALVLKALTIVLAEHLPVSPCCTHVKGHGGAKYALREVLKHLPENRFVLRTDVKSYYASIDHFKALALLASYIPDSTT